MTGRQLLPGLPVVALAAVCPMIAAAILVYREDKRAGVSALLKRSFDFPRITAKGWYAPILLLMPSVMTVSFGALRLAGVPAPAPPIAALPTPLLCVALFIGALGEELGWSGYAIDLLQGRWGALAEAHRPVAWIAGWSLGTVALRVVIVWLYNNAGRSVFAASLFHMTVNVTWQLFPIAGSYYDPGITAAIEAVVAAIVGVVWGPRTLARYRFGTPATPTRRRALPG